MDFLGKDASGNSQQYAKIMCQTDVVTHGQESGRLVFQVAQHDGTISTGMRLLGGDADDEIDVEIGLGAGSTTTVAGDLSVTGTITSGNRVHYRLMGYTTGDGSNYEYSAAFTDAQSPWEHNQTSSADGLTIPAASGTNVSDLFRSGGHVMPHAGTLLSWTGWATTNNNKDLYIGLFKWTPADNDNTTITPVLLDTVTIAGKGNDKVRSFAETSFTQASVAAGDIIFTQMKTETSGNVSYFQSTLEITSNGPA